MTDTKIMVNEVNEVVEPAEAVTAKAKKKSPLARIGALCAVLAACACLALPVSATDGETSATNNQIAETMSQSFTTVASDLGGYAQTVLPAGLAVFAITFCVRKGMGFFRTVAH